MEERVLNLNEALDAELDAELVRRAQAVIRKAEEAQALTLNVDLVRRVQAAIRKEAQAFNMAWWLDGDLNNNVVIDNLLNKVPPIECNTTACIAGWTILVGGDEEQRKSFILTAEDMHYDAELAAEDYYEENPSEVEQIDVPDLAAELLGTRCTSLFYIQDWPEDLEEEYRQAKEEKDYQAAAEVACKVLDNLVANGGKSLDSRS